MIFTVAIHECFTVVLNGLCVSEPSSIKLVLVLKCFSRDRKGHLSFVRRSVNIPSFLSNPKSIASPSYRFPTNVDGIFTLSKTASLSSALKSKPLTDRM
jgi:hypothetical protein